MDYGTEFKQLRETVITCLDSHDDEDHLIAELNRLVSTHADLACQAILHVLTSLDLEPGEARSCWQEILEHRRTLNAAVGRKVGLRTAICDYFTSIHKSLKNPKVVEIHIFEKTVKDSTYDGLTGLFNRRHFDAALQRELALAQRHDSDVSLLFFDIDDFKLINDTHGHHMGDAALQQLAEIILIEKRAGDIAARYGGEEIAIILPHTSNVDALVLGERIRKRVEATPVCRGEKHVGFTISGGLVSYPVDARDAASLMLYVDAAMYRAKGSGKNAISFFSQDKRRYLRIDYQQPINVRELSFEEHETLAGESRNICLGGLLFQSPVAYPIGRRLQIAVPMYDTPMTVIGTVVRVETFGPDTFEIGVSLSFQEMDREARREISRYLASFHEPETPPRTRR